MLKKIMISTVYFLMNFYGVTNAYGQCNNLTGQWEGQYKVKPYVFGFSVGFCEYRTSMKVKEGVNGQYKVVIENTMVDGDGKAGDKCEKEIVMKAKMTCEDNDVRLVTEQTEAGRLDIISQLSEQSMNSKGSFKAKVSGYNMKVRYKLNVNKKVFSSLAIKSSKEGVLR